MPLIFLIAVLLLPPCIPHPNSHGGDVQMKIQQYVKWLFVEECPAAGCDLEFYGQANEGKGDYMVWTGSVGDHCGDFRCYPSAIKNLKDLIKALGSDDSAWVGKRFHLIPSADKKHFVASLF